MIRFLALCVIVAAVILLSVAGAQAGEFSWDDTEPIVTAPVKYDPTAVVRTSGNVRTVTLTRGTVEVAMEPIAVPSLVVEAVSDCASGACGASGGRTGAFRSREVYRAGLLRWPSILRPLQRLAAFRHRS